jgi:hypothetical protein
MNMSKNFNGLSHIIFADLTLLNSDYFWWKNIFSF